MTDTCSICFVLSVLNKLQKQKNDLFQLSCLILDISNEIIEK